MAAAGPAAGAGPRQLEPVDYTDRGDIADLLGLSLVEFLKLELKVASIRDIRSGGAPVPFFLEPSEYSHERGRVARLGLSRRALRATAGI